MTVAFADIPCAVRNLVTASTIQQRKAAILQCAEKQYTHACTHEPKTNEQNEQIANAHVEPSLNVPSQILIQVHHFADERLKGNSQADGIYSTRASDIELFDMNVADRMTLGVPHSQDIHG